MCKFLRLSRFLVYWILPSLSRQCNPDLDYDEEHSVMQICTYVTSFCSFRARKKNELIEAEIRRNARYIDSPWGHPAFRERTRRWQILIYVYYVSTGWPTFSWLFLGGSNENGILLPKLQPRISKVFFSITRTIFSHNFGNKIPFSFDLPKSNQLKVGHPVLT